MDTDLQKTNLVERVVILSAELMEVLTKVDVILAENTDLGFSFSENDPIFSGGLAHLNSAKFSNAIFAFDTLSTTFATHRGNLNRAKR